MTPLHTRAVRVLPDRAFRGGGPTTRAARAIARASRRPRDAIDVDATRRELDARDATRSSVDAPARANARGDDRFDL